MEIKLTADDRRRIEESIHKKYAKVASNPEGHFRYPTGRAALEALNYDPEWIQALPEDVADSFCGVGNLFSLGPIHEGEAVLDIGCGTGVDSLVAAVLVGPDGSVTGIDLTYEMLAHARENLFKTDLDNVTFMEGSAERLPLPDKGIDVVISNGVFNLVPDKVRAVGDILRVLKPNGRLMLADQVLAVDVLPADTKTRVDSWAQ